MAKKTFMQAWAARRKKQAARMRKDTAAGESTVRPRSAERKK